MKFAYYNEFMHRGLLVRITKLVGEEYYRAHIVGLQHRLILSAYVEKAEREAMQCIDWSTENV